MADGEHAAEDRTEAPTQKRLDQARAAGNFPVSQDLNILASLGGGLVGAVSIAPPFAHRMADQAGSLFCLADRLRLTEGTLFGEHVFRLVLTAALLLGAVALPAGACVIACTMLQTQFYVGGAPIRFDASRLNPAAGLARIVSQKHLLDFLKSCGRLVILSWLVWSVLGETPAGAIRVLSTDVAWLLPTARQLTQRFVKPMLIALICFAAVDVLLVRFQHAKSMRMTRDQVRLESRETDGDPFIRAKLKRIREVRSRRRMMAKVKTATVVVTNPTHYAVALSYDDTGAPRVVAKGSDFIAARIRAEADEHKVPVVENPPLARALFQVELDREIPAEHYKAVAEVIAFVWKLKKRRPGTRL